MTFEPPVCFLFDNGSLRAESTLSLRRIAARLSPRLGAEVHPVSLLHSSNVPPAELEGRPAELLEPAVAAWLERRPEGCAVLLPLFFGPSGALVDYLPTRVEALCRRFPRADLRPGSWLAAPGERDLAVALARQVGRTMQRGGLVRPRVVLVDHGSPQRAVTAVRDELAMRLAEELGGQVEAVAPASMERRAESRYAFGDPLLAARLRLPPFDAGDVVVALQFLSPGRHAGPGGDVARICAEAQAERPGLRTWITPTIGEEPEILDVLARRYAGVAGAAS